MEALSILVRLEPSSDLEVRELKSCSEPLLSLHECCEDNTASYGEGLEQSSMDNAMYGSEWKQNNMDSLGSSGSTCSNSSLDNSGGLNKNIFVQPHPENEVNSDPAENVLMNEQLKDLGAVMQEVESEKSKGDSGIDPGAFCQCVSDSCEEKKPASYTSSHPVKKFLEHIPSGDQTPVCPSPSLEDFMGAGEAESTASPGGVSSPSSSEDEKEGNSLVADNSLLANNSLLADNSMLANNSLNADVSLIAGNSSLLADDDNSLLADICEGEEQFMTPLAPHSPLASSYSSDFDQYCKLPSPSTPWAPPSTPDLYFRSHHDQPSPDTNNSNQRIFRYSIEHPNTNDRTYHEFIVRTRNLSIASDDSFIQPPRKNSKRISFSYDPENSLSMSFDFECCDHKLERHFSDPPLLPNRSISRHGMSGSCGALGAHLRRESTNYLMLKSSHTSNNSSARSSISSFKCFNIKLRRNYRLSTSAPNILLLYTT